VIVRGRLNGLTPDRELLEDLADVGPRAIGAAVLRQPVARQYTIGAKTWQ